MKPNKYDMIEALYKSNYKVSTACTFIGIDRETYYRWKRKDKEFSNTVDRMGAGQTKTISTHDRSEDTMVKLKRLIKDLVKVKGKLRGKEKFLIESIYGLYGLVINEVKANSDIKSNVNSGVNISHLYFFKSDYGIKIGSSVDVDRRLRDIKRTEPTAEILKVIKYGGFFEGDLHKRFEWYRRSCNPSHGFEWYSYNSELSNYINSINDVNDLVIDFGVSNVI